MEKYKCICGAEWISEIPKEGDSNPTMDAHLMDCPVYMEALRRLAPIKNNI